jgi:hypothetical protein
VEDYMNQKVNLSSALASFEEVYHPRSVATLNNYKVMVVKVKGDFRLACAHGD